MYGIRFSRDVIKDLKKPNPHYRSVVLDAIERALVHEPTTPTRNRKLLTNLVPTWVAELPIWELRVGKYRVFYDASEEELTVYVRAVREKGRGRTTKEIL